MKNIVRTVILCTLDCFFFLNVKYKQYTIVECLKILKICMQIYNVENMQMFGGYFLQALTT